MASLDDTSPSHQCCLLASSRPRSFLLFFGESLRAASSVLAVIPHLSADSIPPRQPAVYPSPMNLLVYAPGWAIWDGERLRCALGRGGIRADKREGDGATPAGSWPMRRLLYRPDRLAAPAARLPAKPIAPPDGWCDHPAAPVHHRPGPPAPSPN